MGTTLLTLWILSSSFIAFSSGRQLIYFHISLIILSLLKLCEETFRVAFTLGLD